jgi:uncharacterized damage-inducible protein DinB
MHIDLHYIISHWQAVRAGLVDTIGKFHDEELEYKPFTASWSVREIMLHIAQEENGEFNYGITRKLQEFPSGYDEQNYATKASVESLMASVHSGNIEYLKGLDEDALGRVIDTPWGASYRLIEMIDHLIEHEVHHRAELSLILGMLGREGLNA